MQNYTTNVKTTPSTIRVLQNKRAIKGITHGGGGSLSISN